MHSTESRCYRTGKHTVCRHVRESFGPEILPAGAMKGLSICFGPFLLFETDQPALTKSYFETGVSILYRVGTGDIMNEAGSGMCGKDITYITCQHFSALHQRRVNQNAYVLRNSSPGQEKYCVSVDRDEACG